MPENTLNLKPGDVVYRRYCASNMNFSSYIYTLIISVDGEQLYGHDIHKTTLGTSGKFLSNVWRKFNEDDVIVVWRSHDKYPFDVWQLKDILSGRVVPVPGKRCKQEDGTATDTVASRLTRGIEENSSNVS